MAVVRQPTPNHAPLVAILCVAQELDQLGDVLAEWAVDISGPRPDAAVDAVIEGSLPNSTRSASPTRSGHHRAQRGV